MNTEPFGCWVHNNYSGIIMFCYKSEFTSILNKAEKYLIEEFNFCKRDQFIDNQFRFQLKHPTDKGKKMEIHLTFINLKI